MNKRAFQFTVTRSYEAVTLQIPEQGSDITAIAKGMFQATNGWKITSDRSVEIRPETKTIYICGSDPYTKVATWFFHNNTVAEEMKIQITRALNEFKATLDYPSAAPPPADLSHQLTVEKTANSL